MIEHNKYPIHFEPGIHDFFAPQYTEVDRKFQAGDLTVHQWNPQVAERMRQYSPLVIALDSTYAPFSSRGAISIGLGYPVAPEK